MRREQRDEISIFAYICAQRSAVEYRHLISSTRSSNIAVCGDKMLGKMELFWRIVVSSTMDSFKFEEIVSGNGAFQEI